MKCDDCKHNDKKWYELPCDYCCPAHSGYEHRQENEREYQMNDLISRQALMKEFSDFVRASNSSDFAQTPTWNDAVSLVGSMPSAQQWIPCSERLPDKSGEYLITGLHHSGELWVEVDQFDKDGGNSPYQWWHFDEKVIAWLPLPEPYKEGKA